MQLFYVTDIISDSKPVGPRQAVRSARQRRYAAIFGDVVLVLVPYCAVPQVDRDFTKELPGKVALETGNPYPSRDGEMAVTARARGTGTTSAEFLPGVRLVRAFNTIPSSQGISA